MTDPLAEGSRVAVVGGGIMGRGIAIALAAAGLEVRVCETDPAMARGLRDRLRDEAARAGHDDRVPAGIVVEDGLAAAVAGAGLVIEAIPEDMALKRPLWARLGELADPAAILASNTSALDIDELATEVPSPERVLGTHWFNPAAIVPCVEVVRGAATDPDAVRGVVALLERAGKEPVVVRNSPGFVANRIQFAMVREALLCLEEGLASAADIDRIVACSFGLRLAAGGPLGHADLGGLDTYRSVLRFLRGRLGERFAPPALLERLVDEGRLGAKSGAGIAEYPLGDVDRLLRERDATLRRLVAVAAGDEEGEPA
jgi:3-hydroxybutyryl-CoA dehydrogenase